MSTQPTRFITAGVIAAELKVPLHRVLYVLATRSWLQPRAMAGTLRIYDHDQLQQVAAELQAIAGRKPRRH